LTEPDLARGGDSPASDTNPYAAPTQAPQAELPPEPSPRDRATALFEVLLCSSLPTQVLLGAVLYVIGITPTAADGSLRLPFVLALSLADTVLVIALMVLFLHRHGESAREVWIGARPIGREVLRGIGYIPLILLMVTVLINGIRLFFPSLHNVTNNPLQPLASGSLLQAAVFASITIVAGGVREELQRAFLLRRFEQYLGGGDVGVIVLSIGFGLLHSSQGWDAAIATGAIGMFWALVYQARRSAIAPIVSHAGFNSVEVLQMALMGR
jgi:uncharacterized protein